MNCTRRTSKRMDRSALGAKYDETCMPTCNRRGQTAKKIVVGLVANALHALVSADETSRRVLQAPFLYLLGADRQTDSQIDRQIYSGDRQIHRLQTCRQTDEHTGICWV
jgi:hypothetical protein